MTRIVANGSGDAIIAPCLECIAVMQTGDCRRDEAAGTEASRIGQADLGEPGLVPCDLARDIEVCGIVLTLVCECMRHVTECITVGSRCKERLKCVNCDTGG